MNIRKTNIMTKKGIIIIAAIVGLLACAGIAYAVVMPHNSPTTDTSSNDTSTSTNDVDYSPPTQEQQDASKQHKDEIIQNIEQNQSPTTDPAITVTIVRATQSGAGADLNVRALIDGIKEGECIVTLSQAGQASVQKTFPIVFEATTASCQNANIPASELAAGTWKLEVIGRSGSKQSAIASQEVSISR